MNGLTDYSYLVIDDDPFTCDLISSVLRKNGISQIATAENGGAAIKYIKNGQVPDIIICDLNMPEVDGVEFLRFLSEEFFNGGIVLISGTSKTLLNAAHRLGDARSLDMLGLLTKPFTPDDLVQALSKYQRESRVMFASSLRMSSN